MPSFFLLDEIQKLNHSRLVHFIKIKINLNFHFCTFLWCLKGFMYALCKTVVKPEAPQRSVEMKI